MKVLAAALFVYMLAPAAAKEAGFLVPIANKEPGFLDLAGRIVFNGLAVPGATVTATRGDRKVTTVSGEDGGFRIEGVEDGTWTLRVEMLGFAPATREVVVPPSGPPLSITLTLRKYADMASELTKAPAAADPIAGGPVSPKPPSASDAAAQAEDPGIINGSSINGAASVFAQARAFGNNRPNQRVLYTGGLSAVLGNSAWNAEPFSFGGSTARVPQYNDVQLGFTLGGPLKIPWLVKSGPQFVLNYQHGLLNNATTQSALMPTPAQRAGDFSQLSTTLRDPRTGLPFAGNIIPADRISPQAAALLAYYPLPNAETTAGANYGRPVLGATTSDNFQFALSKSLSNRTSIGGSVRIQRSVAETVSLFDFTDRNRTFSTNAGLNWLHRFNQRSQLSLRYQFTHASTTVTPFFANRVNVSGDAGISGNSQDPLDWGPPSLSFSDVAGLHDVNYESTVSLTHSGGAELSLKRGRHQYTMGGDAKWNGFNVSSQPDPRGTLAFTGAVTGSGFADFLLGFPATSAIAYGNTDARLRGGTYDAYINDDFRVGAGLTLNAGLRWEYEAPFTEASGSLVNLDVAPGFSAVAPVLATSPVGLLTGQAYPTSLVRPDKRGFEPRIAAAWRPLLGSSLVIKSSYGLYKNLGVYQPLALLLAQQPPFSRTLSVPNNPLAPLTLANPFPDSLPSTNTFAVDPGFRSGMAQQWQVSAQRDFPASLTLLASYDGSKGSHLTQAFLPNTYPTGAVNPCASCPSGFVYITSNGSSLRNAAQVSLRRRLHSGLTAGVQYTFSKSTDDAATFNSRSIAPGSLAIAQDWLNLSAERGPSSFDQRHVMAVQFQYTSGQGVAGGTLIDGFWGTLVKDWTVVSQLTTGSGLPFTPVQFTTIAGTGIVGVRPSLTGATTTPTGNAYANPEAYTVAAPGTWGDAGRNSIRGPAQFALDASVARVFRLHGRMNLEWRLAATNVLNRVTFATINTTITSPQFGQPTSANQMRRLQMTLRLRF